MANECEGEMGSLHDEVVGEFLIIRRDDLPTETAETAAGFLRLQRIPNVVPSTITHARKKGELPATVIGNTVLYSRHDLLQWIRSRHGNSAERFASVRETMRGNQNARRSN